MHMARFPDKVDSKFRYVLLAARRAEQLMRGAEEKVPRESPKLARHAMKELELDLVGWDYGEAPEPSASAGADDDGTKPADEDSGSETGTVN